MLLHLKKGYFGIWSGNVMWGEAQELTYSGAGLRASNSTTQNQNWPPGCCVSAWDNSMKLSCCDLWLTGGNKHPKCTMHRGLQRALKQITPCGRPHRILHTWRIPWKNPVKWTFMRSDWSTINQQHVTDSSSKVWHNLSPLRSQAER